MNFNNPSSEQKKMVLNQTKSAVYQVMDFLKKNSLAALENGKRPNGIDTAARFENEAGKIALKLFSDFSKEHNVAIRILVDSLPLEILGAGTPTLTVFIDPVNGSNNFRRASGISICSSFFLMGAERPLKIENVDGVFIRDIDSESAGEGNGTDVRTGRFIEFLSGENPSLMNWRRSPDPLPKDLSDALVGFNACFRDDADPRMVELVKTLAFGGFGPDGTYRRFSLDARDYGSAVLSSVYVAKKSIGAYVNIGTKSSTVFDILPGAAIIQWEGGVVGGLDGKPLGEFDLNRLDQTYDYVMAASPGLYAQLVKYFQSG
ncbi:Uncharacterised protein [uncultured archaeon]|nr:Uncharacterised protein [uncultured archaeon]